MKALEKGQSIGHIDNKWTLGVVCIGGPCLYEGACMLVCGGRKESSHPSIPSTPSIVSLSSLSLRKMHLFLHQSSRDELTIHYTIGHTIGTIRNTFALTVLPLSPSISFFFLPWLVYLLRQSVFDPLRWNVFDFDVFSWQIDNGLSFDAHSLCFCQLNMEASILPYSLLLCRTRRPRPLLFWRNKKEDENKESMVPMKARPECERIERMWHPKLTTKLTRCKLCVVATVSKSKVWRY